MPDSYTLKRHDSKTAHSDAITGYGCSHGTLTATQYHDHNTTFYETNMNRVYPLFIVLALGSQAAFSADQDIIARMGHFTLTESDVRSIILTTPEAARTATDLEKRLRTDIIRRAIAAEARQQAYDKKPDTAARMQQAAEQVLVTSYMNSIAQPPKDFPSEALLKQAYEANKTTLKTPLQYRISQIYVAGTDEKSRKRALELTREARLTSRNKSDFAAMAKKSSQHAASAANGGDLGWLTEADLAPPFRQALAAMLKGEVSSNPIAGAEGWHILKLVDRKEPEMQSFDQVREVLTRNLRLRKAVEIEQNYLNALLARTPISVNGIKLEELAKR
jgi:parvulin-like peptidyl-prolyl isomerase